jgi:kynurenine formamidase
MTLMISDLLGALAAAKIYDLGHSYHPGMPHHPVHPPFLFCLAKAHGEYLRDGVSSASEAVTLGGHVGTHIDALCHFSKNGKLHGGVDAAAVQSYTGGVRHADAETIGPIFRRGVLLDIAGYLNLDVLPVHFAVRAEVAEDAARARGIEIRPGDVVLIRTGWARYWPDPRAYIAEVRGPGIEETAARWLSGRKIFAAGSDTVAFEFVPSSMPVHAHFLVEKGIHILEALDLEALARDGVAEFVFAAIPLKICGGTGSPVRPLALVSAARGAAVD